MLKYIFNFLIIIILSLIVIFDFSIICLGVLLFVILLDIIKIKNKKVLFFVSYIAFLLICLINVNINKSNKTNFENHSFKVLEVKNNYYIIKDKRNKYLIYDKEYHLKEGNKIRINGKFQEIKAQGIPHLFDYKSYCKHHKIRGQIDVYKLDIIDEQVSLRRQIIDLSINELKYSKDEIGLIIFGINSDNIDDLYQSLINLSLIHLFVISGFHFNFLYLSLKKVLKKDALTFPFLMFYLYMLDFSISATRSLLFLLYKKIDKKKKINNIQILSLISLFFIIINPYVIFYSSFILTFVLSFFIELIKICCNNQKGIKSKLMWIILPYLSVLPIVINLQGKMSAFQIFIQVLVTPFIPILYLLSFIVILIPSLDFYYFILFNGMKGIFQIIEQRLSYLNFRMINDGIIFIYYFLLFLFYKNLYLKRNNKCYLIIYCMCLTFFGYNYYSFNEPCIYFLDVGQGDSALIRGKNNSYNILIDTGGQLYQDIAIKRHVPLFKKLGIKKIDLVFISHGDYDHNGALESLQSNFKIDKIIASSSFPPYLYKDLLIYNLNPNTLNSKDENENSQILYFKFLDKFFLFTGDMSVNNEKEFMKTYHNIDVDILKVAHHGSDTSSSDEFLDFIKPEIAIISVGLNNKYGHPSNEVISNLEERNIKIYRTDTMGTIVLMKNIFNKFKIYQTIIN